MTHRFSARFTRFALLSATLALAACTQVDSTEHCVETRYGDIVTEKMSPGIHSTFTTDANCFSLVQHTWPEGTDDKGAANSEKVSFMTRDSVTIDAEMAIQWNYADALGAFKTKRSHDAVLLEVSNAVRSGMRDFGALITLPDLFGPRRAELEPIAKQAIQNKVGGYVRIDNVYLRKLDPPAQIMALWQENMKQAAEQTKARSKYITDSLEARRSTMIAEAEAKQTQLRNQAMASNPAVLALERDKVLAEASAKLLSNCTSNCIIGGTSADRYFMNAGRAP